jgi:hypothetical protein
MKNALAKTAVLAALLAAAVGCSRDEGQAQQQAAAPEVSPAAPESYMKDKAFRAKLDGQVAKRGELASARNTIVAQMTEMIEAKKKELGTDDEAKLKAALEKDPAWNELYRRCQDANTAIGENRKETMAVVRKRLTNQTIKQSNNQTISN